MIMRHLARLNVAGLALIFLLCGCGPRVFVAPQYSAVAPQRLALLPVAAQEDIKREKISFIYDALYDALKGEGFRVLDSKLVKRVCSSSACPEQTTLAKRYKLDGFLRLSLDSADRTNALAGFYNEISGTLSELSIQGEKLAEVEHTQRETGGLLFSSGQLLTGLSATVDNLGDKSFPRLAEKFAAQLAQKLPKAPDNLAQPLDQIAISEVQLKTYGDSRYEICLSGTPGQSGYVVISGIRTNLREIQSGQYCSVLELDRLISDAAPARVELRSAFGGLTEKALPKDYFYSCDPAPFLRLAESPRALNFETTCTELPDSAQQKSCRQNGSTCGHSRFLVFAAQSTQGPYQRIATQHATPWKAKLTKPWQDLAVIAVTNDGGLRSLPKRLNGLN